MSLMNIQSSIFNMRIVFKASIMEPDLRYKITTIEGICCQLGDPALQRELSEYVTCTHRTINCTTPPCTRYM
jgi:hypothetical protein